MSRSVRDTIQSRIHEILIEATGLPGYRCTRARPDPVDVRDCPAIDFDTRAEDTPTRLGSADDRTIEAVIQIYTAGAEAAAAADPIATAIHTAIHADTQLAEICYVIRPGNTEFSHDDGATSVARTTVQYRLSYLSARGDLAVYY